MLYILSVLSSVPIPWKWWRTIHISLRCHHWTRKFWQSSISWWSLVRDAIFASILCKSLKVNVLYIFLCKLIPYYQILRLLSSKGWSSSYLLFCLYNFAVIAYQIPRLLFCEGGSSSYHVTVHIVTCFGFCTCFCVECVKRNVLLLSLVYGGCT